MEAAIITLHRVYNYGSVLQAYATYKIIKKYVDECYIIDYYSEFRTPKSIWLSCPDSLKKNSLKRGVYYIIKLPSIILKCKTFYGFLKKNVKMSQKKYIQFSDLLVDVPFADIYITGSDQVWNSVYNRGIDKAFYLQFVPSEKKKIAFSASIGTSEFEKSEEEEILSYLNGYDAISVREREGEQLLKKHGIKNVCAIIDPTLQLDVHEYKCIMSSKLIRQPYLILMLLYNEDENATNIARMLADKYNLKLVKISWELRKPKNIDILMTHRSPEDFLSLFYYANFIVTNSFHGLAFSIKFNKQFIVIPRKEFNSRIENLLSLCDLKDRLIQPNSDIDILYNNKINYKIINDVIKNETMKAQTFLKNSLKEYI